MISAFSKPERSLFLLLDCAVAAKRGEYDVALELLEKTENVAVEDIGPRTTDIDCWTA